MEKNKYKKLFKLNKNKDGFNKEFVELFNYLSVGGILDTELHETLGRFKTQKAFVKYWEEKEFLIDFCVNCQKITNFDNNVCTEC